MVAGFGGRVRFVEENYGDSALAVVPCCAPVGSWFGAYDSTHFVANASVGTASVRFDSATNATLTYSVNGKTGTKSITRQTFGAANAAPITNYTDIWWGGTAENGWGMVLAQQYHDIFAAWYTYDSSGKPTWLVMPGGTWTSTNTYTGALFRTRSAPVPSRSPCRRSGSG